MAEIIASLGFSDRYDFLYMPSRGGTTFGYGFINFFTPQDATEFSRAFTDYQFEGSKKIGAVKPAFVQGKAAVMLHLRLKKPVVAPCSSEPCNRTETL